MSNDKWFNELFSDLTISELTYEIEERMKSIINDSFGSTFHSTISINWLGDLLIATVDGVEYHVESLLDALCNYTNEDFDNGGYFDLSDYLQNCEYTPEASDSNILNELKTDNELSFSEKRQVALIDWLLGEPASVHETSSLVRTEASTLNELVEELDKENKQLKDSVKSLTFSRENDYQECLKYITSEKTHLDKWIKQLQEKYQVLEKKNQELEQIKEYNQAWVDNLQQRVHDLECAVYLLQQENKQLKNQSEAKPETQPEPKLTDNKAKKPKFKLPENFTDYQQECDDLIDALSCFYSIKKGKWGKDILQFILIPTDTEKTKLPYPDKWKAGLYLQPGQWTIDKVKLTDPDEWEEWFMDINDFADSNGIEIS